MKVTHLSGNIKVIVAYWLKYKSQGSLVLGNVKIKVIQFSKIPKLESLQFKNLKIMRVIAWKFRFKKAKITKKPCHLPNIREKYEKSYAKWLYTFQISRIDGSLGDSLKKKSLKKY